MGNGYKAMLGTHFTMRLNEWRLKEQGKVEKFMGKPPLKVECIKKKNTERYNY